MRKDIEQRTSVYKYKNILQWLNSIHLQDQPVRCVDKFEPGEKADQEHRGFSFLTHDNTNEYFIKISDFKTNMNSLDSVRKHIMDQFLHKRVARSAFEIEFNKNTCLQITTIWVDTNFDV